MNNETHEDRVKILSGAPPIDGIEHDDFLYCEGAASNYVIINESTLYTYECGKWCEDKKGNYPLQDCWGIRSLADIQKLVDMQNEIDELNEDYKTLERNSFKMYAFKNDIHQLLCELLNSCSDNGKLDETSLDESKHTDMDNLNWSQKLLIELRKRVSKYD